MAEAILEKRLTELWESPKSIYGFFSTVDHKKLGIRYLVTAFFFLLVGGVEALIMRIQLAQPDLRVLSPEAYNQIFTLHGTTMTWWKSATPGRLLYAPRLESQRAAGIMCRSSPCGHTCR